ncbi:tetratricopeptide repeat protein 8-like [Octopus sinensis]|uniref:Tetratricopeptide repeat protein 8-like n=1 Tax=Octopus sinensis TaxID=2607531 RepID=A0A6P7TJ65_9MOLL|nr:tetratricopeptide repeat protein 8-like [Octopus sinensis]XP_036367783.1 tetratricopeptide repeat protein 8-like [Octopus sinensis]
MPPFERMHPMFYAISNFRRRKFKECAELCTSILEKTPYDEAAWSLKTRALTEQVYVDDADLEEETIAESILDENALAQNVRPGTSLQSSSLESRPDGINPAIRPVTQSGRPVTGFIRPGTQSSRPGTMESALQTARTAHTARPVSSTSARYVRLGTASMVSSPDGAFINLARLNLNKYSLRPELSKSLFEYIFYHENDIRTASKFANMALKNSKDQVWWWQFHYAKCCYRMGLYRDAEVYLKQALSEQETVAIYHYISKVYVKLDQPLNAIDMYKSGLNRFAGEVTLLIGIARIYESLNQLEESVKYYRKVLELDSMQVEAIACIATNHFYNDQPEVALKYFRRLLQMGVYKSELFCNMGLCCFYAQQFDMVMVCFSKALALADDNMVLADIWYNVGHVAIGIGDLDLAHQCFRMALSNNNDHAEAYNNFGVIELKRGHWKWRGLSISLLLFWLRTCLNHITTMLHSTRSLVTCRAVTMLC